MTLHLFMALIQHTRPIVVVDDDHDDFLLFRDAYKESKCEKELLHYDDPLKFLEYLWTTKADNYPSLVILDYNMPVVHGKQILKEVRSLPKFEMVPFIILSTGNGERERREFLRIGANGCYTKPQDHRSLVKVVIELMDTYC